MNQSHNLCQSAMTPKLDLVIDPAAWYSEEWLRKSGALSERALRRGRISGKLRFAGPDHENPSYLGQWLIEWLD